MSLNTAKIKRAIRECRAASLSITALAVLLTLSACAESTRPEATGKGRVRGINSVVTSPELIFVIEERPQGNVNYRAVSGFTEWDDLSYNFNFDLLPPDQNEPDRIASALVNVLANTEHTIVLTGTLANPSILAWEEPEREWTGTETVFEVDFFHVSPLLGDVDVYYAIEGTVPVLGNEIATLSNGDRVPYVELPEGDYELFVTAPDDPATVIFQSSALTRLPAERVSIGLFDTDPSIVSPIGVNVIFDGGAAQALTDVNSSPQIRLSHASVGVENINGYFNDDFDNVIFPNVAFGETTAYVGTSETVTPLDVTLVSAPATTVAETDVQRVNDVLRSFIFWGLPGEHLLRTLVHDARPIEVFPVTRVTDLAANIESLDIYVVEPGTVLDETVVPRFGGAIPGISTDFFSVDEGMLEFVLTLSGEKTPIATPLVFDFANGDVLDLIIVDTADPAVVELRVFDSIP